MSNITISNQASKIYIINSGDEVLRDDEHVEPKNSFCDVTIHTSFNVSIPNTYSHIRIKNNFKSEAPNGDEIKSDQDEAFAINEDVLLNGSDEKLYLGTVTRIKNGKYLVKFDDNTEKWSLPHNLKKFNTSTSKTKLDEPLCVVCKEKNENDLVEVCHKCSRGYHQLCHGLSRDVINFSSPWCCDRCTSNEIISISDEEENESENERKFRYDMKSLNWDSNHRENKENVYCYCGKQGLWKNQMLQCCKCQQWFHQNCVSSWKGVLMHGDTFFVFCCSICNGSEFLCRLELNWSTIIHLVLFEFSVKRPQKYYSISKELSTYIWENWNKLNFPCYMKITSKDRLVKKISQTVKKEEKFKSFGGNVNLRRRITASSPKVCIPESLIASEKTLRKLNVKYFPLNDELVDEPSQGIKNKEKIYDDSSDENSSKSALDWIIPPPSNFHGKNNPFHSQYRPAKTSGKVVKKGQNFEKLPEIRIVRTIKRRLSAKDIALGLNPEAKKRKSSKRRKLNDSEIISEIFQPFTMPLPHLPVRRESRDVRVPNFVNENCTESNRYQKSAVISENFLKTSNEICKLERCSNVTDSVMNSPVKNKSINMYFGAFNRIENGENFKILAKRLTLEGKEQYLLEWTTKSELTTKE